MPDRKPGKLPSDPIRRIGPALRAIAWRVGGGLAALPAHVISIFLVYHGTGEAVGDLYRWLFPPRLTGRVARRGVRLAGSLLLGLPVAIAMAGTALYMVITVGRAVFHPVRLVWDRPPGLVVLVIGDLVLRGCARLIRALVYRGEPAGAAAISSRNGDRTQVRPPGRAPRPSGPAARQGTLRPR